jgi:hypothetical protein
MKRRKKKKVYNMNNSKNFFLKNKQIIYFKLYTNKLKKILDNKEPDNKELKAIVDNNIITIDNVLTLLDISNNDILNNDAFLFKYLNNIDNYTNTSMINNFINKAYKLKLISKRKINKFKIYRFILINNLNSVNSTSNKFLFDNKISNKIKKN